MVMLVKFSYGYHCCWPKNHATIHNRKIRLFFFVCFFFLRSNPSKEKRTYDQIIIKRNKKTVRLMFSYSSRRCILTRSHRIFPIVDDIGRQFGVDKSLRHVFLTFFGRGLLMNCQRSREERQHRDRVLPTGIDLHTICHVLHTPSRSTCCPRCIYYRSKQKERERESLKASILYKKSLLLTTRAHWTWLFISHTMSKLQADKKIRKATN